MSTADDEKLQECDRRAYAKPLLVNHGSIADTTGRFRFEEEMHGPDMISDFPAQ